MRFIAGHQPIPRSSRPFPAFRGRAPQRILAGLLTLMPGMAVAQTPDWLLPDRELLPSLLAAPREPVVKGMLVYADRNPTAYGPGVAGEVAIAGAVAVIRLAGSDGTDAVVLGMEGAAFAHFSLAVVTRELVNTDWVFAVPLVTGAGTGSGSGTSTPAATWATSTSAGSALQASTSPAMEPT